MKIGVSLPVREMQNDLVAIRDFAQAAEGLGLNHLRVPDQVFRKNNKHLHEPMMLLSYIAAITTRIELVPSVIVLPARQTVLFAKQATELDVLSGGRVRVGVGVGGSREEYVAGGEEFSSRGRRCDEQLQILKTLWRGGEQEFQGEFDRIEGGSLNPLPSRHAIPIWIGGAAVPSKPVLRRIGLHADGWFVLCSPEQFVEVRDAVTIYTMECGRDMSAIGAEAGVAVVGSRAAEWQTRVQSWQDLGLSHLCLRTLGGGLSVAAHVPKLTAVVSELPVAID